MQILPMLIAVLMLLPACGRKGDLIIPGSVLPKAVTGLQADPRGDSVILAWSAPVENSAGEPLTGLAGYMVERAELPGDGGDCPCLFQREGYVDLELPGGAVVADGRVAWRDGSPGLKPGGRYAYKVVPVNEDGFSGPDSEVIKLRLLTLPAAPQGLTATAGNRRVVLMWESPSMDVSGAPVDTLAGYNVYRALDKDASPAIPVNPTPVQGGSFEDSGLANGQTYYYIVSALRGTEGPYTEGDAAGPVQAMPADTEPPSVPVGLRAVPGEGRVLMSWDPSPDMDLAGYVVYRRGPGESDAKELGRTGPGWITFEDAGVAPGGEYAYTVSAFDDATPSNESAASEEYSVILP
ncbi:MAG: fibronectin type III domain-containing protein [Nitrospirae bacterium]|nr:fibronectin type III domain-containing protein [Nitrospirota bacterium]